MVAVGDTAGLITAVNDLAPQYGIDPAAALAIARQEGWSGGIGDNGMAYGPWQDWFTNFQGRGPWYGAGANNQQVQQWAWSTAGIQEALSEMAAQQGVKGTTGTAAISAIATNFERPSTNYNGRNLLQEEINNAEAIYNQFTNGGSGPTGAVSQGSSSDPIAGGVALIQGESQSAGSTTAQPILGSQALGTIVSRLGSKGFWWSAGFFILAALLIIVGLLVYFHKQVGDAIQTVGRDATVAAAAA